MAKITDKFFNRVIEGPLQVSEDEAKKIAQEGVYLVSDVKSLSNEVISQLKAGDIVVKHDNSGNHPYIVSFRGETGICLTYTDASCVETQSYDKVGQNWVYNSEDKTILPINGEYEGNLEINGNLTADEIVENMSGYSAELYTVANYSFENVYTGAVKTGNKLTIVFALYITKEDASAVFNPSLARINMPTDILAKLYPANVGSDPVLSATDENAFSTINANVICHSWVEKDTTGVKLQINATNLVANTKYYFRKEVTFLLSDNLIPQE